MKTFPCFVFRAPGSIMRARYSYDMLSVANEDWLKNRLANGWYMTLDEALEAAGQKAVRGGIVRQKPRKPSKPLDGINRRVLSVLKEEEKKEELSEEDNSEPSRSEMENKARELKLKFDGRTSDKKLLAMIDAALNK